MRLEVRVGTSSRAGYRLGRAELISDPGVPGSTRTRAFGCRRSARHHCRSPLKRAYTGRRFYTKRLLAESRVPIADSRLSVRNHALDFGLVGFIDHGVQVQAPFRLLRLGRKNMAHERVPTLHPTAGGLLEALRSATVGLKFWHRSSANS